MRMTTPLEPIHPGEILLEEFMKPLGIGISQLALALDAPASYISALVSGTCPISADMAVRLGTYFGMSAETWLGLQTEYDLRVLRQADALTGPAS